MRGLCYLSVIAAAGHASAAAVFAHFMVGNANNYTLSDWQTDIQLASKASLDAFALNIAYGDDTVSESLILAFQAAEDYNFSLFFSFDYAGGSGPWPQADVIGYLTQYSATSAYYRYNGQPFVSTFEGPNNAEDWIEIKAQTGCFFIPDWSSLGAEAALKAGGGGIVDGLFNWAAWPWGTRSMDTYTDGSYYNYMGKNISGPDPGSGMPYMMAVSPWFYTNLPGYHKNWLWKSDNLWYDRWMEAIYNEPEFIEIISWNDYGESHYIGPLYEYAYEAPMTIGEAPINYVENMPHDGWRKFLPYVTELYKTGISVVNEEGLVGWYRTSPGQACGTGDTTGNTASQLQIEFEPYEVMEDSIFYTALLVRDAIVTVFIGGASQTGSWTWTPDTGVGLYHGSVPFNGAGDVVITLSRGGTTIAEISGGPAISNNCSAGLTNWNAWVGEADGPKVEAITVDWGHRACVSGTGVNNFQGLCFFSCQYGYCPISACVCEAMGAAVAGPNATGPVGYPIAGLDASYSGVCAFDCERNYCPPSACSTVSAPLSTPTVSDFSPPACIAGQVLSTVSDGLKGLCSFACNYGFCPMHACECTAQGALVDSNSIYDGKVGTPIPGLEDWGLCAWSCARGYCPPGACNNGTSTGTGSGIVYVEPDVWVDPTPTVGCEPPCTLIFPPIPLATPLTFTWPPYATGLYSSSGSVTMTITTIISLAPFTVSEIDFWPVTINSDDPDTGVIFPVQSITPPSTSISLPSDQAAISVGSETILGSDGQVTLGYTGGPATWGGGYVPIQPQPTISIPIPTSDYQTTQGATTTQGVTTTTHSVTYTRSSTAVSSTCTSPPCGHRTCLFGCGHGCGLFGCWGGCGLFGCGGGGCGLGGCGGGDWNNHGCGPAGCGCTFGCDSGGDDGEGGSQGCSGPDCDKGCQGDDCGCDESKTVTSCGVLCTQTVAFTTSYLGDCSTTTCATTSCGTDTTSTETTTTTLVNDITITAMATDPIWTPDTTDAFVGAVWSDYLSWSAAKDAAAASASTTTTTTTSSLPYPTNTAVNVGSALCFADYNSNGQYVQFTEDDAKAVVAAACDNDSHVLTPSNTYGFVEEYSANGYMVYASFSWAADQSGCGTMANLDLTSDGCLDAFDTDFFECNGETDNPDYGGAYVYNTGKGCVLISLYAINS